jgi:hypothetical protein
MADMVAKGRGDTSGLLVAQMNLGKKLHDRAARLRTERAVAAGHPGGWKRCSRCQIWKAPECFGGSAGRPDGLQTYCRPCRLSRRRAA